jgi:hypothetical protein
MECIIFWLSWIFLQVALFLQALHRNASGAHEKEWLLNPHLHNESNSFNKYHFSLEAITRGLRDSGLKVNQAKTEVCLFYKHVWRQ